MEGSELLLDIAEVSIENLMLDGSLQIKTQNKTGHDEKGVMIFSDLSSSCVLENIQIINAGINHVESMCMGQYLRGETCLIELEENAELIAKDVTLRGDIKIHVPKNTRILLKEVDGLLVEEKQPIESKKPLYSYSMNAGKEILLKRQP
jgi:hypothetical protein